MSELENRNSKQCFSVKSFYGSHLKTSFEANASKTDYAKTTKLPHRLNNLLGPTQIWKVFQKQNDALGYARHKRSGLMTFAFQQWDGTRAFLVAHPKIFWYYDIQKHPSERCTYEIIPESCACKLYFDLEFEIEFNQEKKGALIVDTFVTVVLHFIQVLLNIKLSRRDILCLDSSTNIKFSRHLIFVSSSLVFCHNINVGEFVFFICQKIKLYLMSFSNPNKESDGFIISNNICKCCQFSGLFNSGCIKDIGLTRESLQSLIVHDRKGKEQLICDCSVYSRNRHFRLFQNTKWKKDAPLLLSADNLYHPNFSSKSNISDVLLSEALFLDSLISNIESQLDKICDVQVIYFRKTIHNIDNPYAVKVSQLQLADKDTCKAINISSPYPEIDMFINSLVRPGCIRKSVYFSSSSLIVYDIFGYRYCQNIGRQHQSNNVKYIVNLSNYTYYQKCYDPDCSTFCSVPNTLPIELKMKLEEDSFEKSECNGISDVDLVEAANVIEDLLNDQIFM